MQVKETLLQKCQEVEQTAREQATDNAILDQLHKVISFVEVATLYWIHFLKLLNWCCP